MKSRAPRSAAPRRGPARAQVRTPARARAATATPPAIDRIIRGHLSSLRKPGVLSVRPGFEITRHRLTGAAAIVATVYRKQRSVPAAARLPERIAGLPVDVREATPQQRLRAKDPTAAALMQTMGRPEEREPDWPYEREMPSGALYSSPKSRHQRLLAAQARREPGLASALKQGAQKPRIPYVPAPNTPLVPIVGAATITACVSPDAGFATIGGFLGGCRSSLLIGMYDFTSGPLLDAFEQDLTGARTLRMVLDNPVPNATRNQTDSETVQALDAALGARATIARALTRPDPYAAAYMFPSAYHIKLIVRDGAALWLSSGNLNNSNLPDPASPPSTEDRDWHVIIESPALAQLFAAYLEQDYASASAHQVAANATANASANAAARDAVTDAAAKLAAETDPRPPAVAGRARAAAAASVKAQAFTLPSVKITPLLTPDKLAADPNQGQYVAALLDLIGAAQQRLYVQLQYIEASSASGAYASLLAAIAARARAGVDVRLIESLEYGEKWAEKMKSTGVDLTAQIRLQPNVHNKGFVIDSSIVVVSSQNFSPEGVSENRDAGVIIESAAVAQYFEAVFLADWTQRAKPFAPPA